MYSDENKSSAIAAILNRFDYVLIDTCSLMDPACPVWMDALHNAKDYRKKREPIIVPRRCYDELKKHSRDKSIDSRRIAAKRGLKILRKAKWDRLLAVAKKDKNENFADNAIYVQVCADRLFSRILIITQDKSLASDLLALNRLRSQQGRPVEVFKLISDGKMVPNLGEPNADDRREPRVGGYPKQTSSNKPSTPQPAKGANTPAEIQAADARLCAVLSNPNYPEEKKKADAESQLKALRSLSSSAKAKLKLKMDVDRIQEFLSSGNKAAKPQQKAEPAKKPVPEKKEAPQKNENAKKSEPVKEEKPVGERLYYGAGKTLQLAVADCASHYGILFREPSVRYFPQAHGPFDLTNKDRDEIIALALSVLKGETKVAFAYHDIPMWAQKVSDDRYKYWIDVHYSKPAPEPKKAAEAPAKQPAKKPSSSEKAAKAAEVEKKEKAAKAGKASDQKAAPKKAEPKKEAPKQDEPKKETPKPSAKKATAPKKAEKKTSEPAKKPTEPKVTQKKEAKKPEPAKKAAPAKADAPSAKPKSAPKKTAKAKQTPPASDNFKKAQQADKRLNAVLSNPNYALKDKIADLKAQRNLLMTLTEAEFLTLKYGPKQIDEWLKANQGFEQGSGEE